MITVSLEGMRFHGGHGLHAGERLTGNEFEVTLHADIGMEEPVGGLSESVDYESVYDMVSSVMKNRHDLLEQLAWQITLELKARFPLILRSEVLVRKLHPPLGGETAASSVKVVKKY